MVQKRHRILVGKVGLDGHDVGARVVARALADSGMEVIYTGLRQTPEMIAKAAIEEAVDIVGISILSGSHMTLLPEILRALNRLGATDIPLIAGGIIPVEDIPELKAKGIRGVFPPDTPMAEIVEFVKKLLESNDKTSYKGTL
jgi:methylmalonyl-CoA mutase, C-terminal domain